MYRKIIFISVTVMQDADINTRATLLLFFAAFFYISTKIFQPFVLKELNLLEGFSNFAALVSLFFGCLFVLNIEEPLKFLSYFVILIVNVIFLVRWSFSVFRLFLAAHRQSIEKYFPNFVDRFYELQDRIFNISLASFRNLSLKKSIGVENSERQVKELNTQVVKINIK